MWRPARARLVGDQCGQALLDAMEDEHRLIGPLRAVTDDAFTMGADHVRLRQLLTRLRTRVTSHLTHEEAVALPLIATVMSPGELGQIARAIGGGYHLRRAARTVPWVLASAAPDVRAQALGQLHGPARLFYRRVWLPRHRANHWGNEITAASGQDALSALPAVGGP